MTYTCSIARLSFFGIVQVRTDNRRIAEFSNCTVWYQWLPAQQVSQRPRSQGSTHVTVVPMAASTTGEPETAPSGVNPCDGGANGCQHNRRARDRALRGQPMGRWCQWLPAQQASQRPRPQGSIHVTVVPMAVSTTGEPETAPSGVNPCDCGANGCQHNRRARDRALRGQPM